MTKAEFLTTIFSLLFLITTGQTKTDLNIHFMLRGHIYAHSSIEDTAAFGGFGGSDNLPKRMDNNINFSETGLFLKIDTTKAASFTKTLNGYKFYIGNKTDTVVQLEASDSRLYVIAEVYYQGKWQPIEYLPSSWCGNSYHNVYLKQNEYWTFDIPIFSGRIKAKLRYRLMIGNNRFIYSNEITTSINKKQLSQKQGHKSNGMMDPYID